MKVNLKSSENIVGSIQMNWVATSMLLADSTKGKEQVFYVGKGQKNGCSIISLVLSNIRNSQRSNLLEKNLSEYNEYIILDIK